jgi:hypothetical protein
MRNEGQLLGQPPKPNGENLYGCQSVSQAVRTRPGEPTSLLCTVLTVQRREVRSSSALTRTYRSDNVLEGSLFLARLRTHTIV